MKITPRNDLILVKKHKNTKLHADIVVAESSEDKRLITGEILDAGQAVQYEAGETIIFGKYAVLTLTIQGENFEFIAIDDIVGTCDYKE